MFKIDSSTKQINITRGDVASIRVSAKNSDGTDYTFNVGDVVRFKVFEKNNCSKVFIQKDTTVSTAGTTVDVVLNGTDTKLGEIINKPVKYWYEIELNPLTNPQTIVCYDEDGEKLFVLYPEGDVRE